MSRTFRSAGPDGRPHLVVLASTFPRWAGDAVPGFVLELLQRVRPAFSSATVVAPHYSGARRRERLAGDVEVRRFRYAVPARRQNLAYGEFRRGPGALAKAAVLVGAEALATLRAAAGRRPVVLHAHWLVPQGFVAALAGRLLGARVVVSVHGSDVFTLNDPVNRRAKRFALRHADVVVANSAATRDACRELWPGREYPVLPMGVDTDLFAPLSGSAGGEPALVGAADRLRVVFAGRLHPVKGVEVLLSAVGLLAGRGVGVSLTIAGDGPLRSSLEERAVRDGLADRVCFAGWLQPPGLAALFQQADVLCAPSLDDASGREGFGLVLAEAAAAGLPVVATRSGGTADVVVHGDTGLLVAPGDAAALADALAALAADPASRRRMGEAGRQRVTARLSWPVVAAAYRRWLLGGEGPGAHHW